MHSLIASLLLIVCVFTLIMVLGDYFAFKRVQPKGKVLNYLNFVAMRIRVGEGIKVILNSSIRCQSHNIPFELDMLEKVYLLGGDLEKLTDVIISSKNQKKLITWDDLTTSSEFKKFFSNNEFSSGKESISRKVQKESFCENEQTKILSHYVDGCLKKVEHIYPNGQKKIETFLSKGRRYVFLYKDGKLLEAEVWIEGGQKCTETNLINGNGTVRFFDEDGSVLINYKNGERLPASLITVFKLMFRKSPLGKLIGYR